MWPKFRSGCTGQDHYIIMTGIPRALNSPGAIVNIHAETIELDSSALTASMQIALVS